MTAAWLSGLLVAGGACDASVTSVGAWQPIVNVTEPMGAQSGSGGNAGTGGAGAGGVAGAGSAGMAGQAAGEGGAPESPGQYLEAESGEITGGFTIGDDAAASSGQYIEGPAMVTSDQSPGAALARYTFNIEADGNFVIWGRIWSPDVSSNRFWFQVDGGNWITWRITVGKIWYWNYFHVDTLYNDVLHFPLTAGAHTLLIANEVPGARLDRLYITGAGDRPPGNDTPCNPPHSIDFDGAGDCHPSCGAQAPVGMHTTCLSATCEGKDIKDMRMAYDCGVCCVVP